MERLYNLLDKYNDEMVKVRRYLHENPELSFQEVNTAHYIANYHQKLGHTVKVKVGGNGVVAILEGGKPGKTVALRADFDAIEVHEKGNTPYKSKTEGVMHACGHDGHTAILLILAKALNEIKEDIEGRRYSMFFDNLHFNFTFSSYI